MTDTPHPHAEALDSAPLDRPVPDASIDVAVEPQSPAHDSEATHNVMDSPPEIETGINMPLGRVATGGDEPGEPSPADSDTASESPEPSRTPSSGDITGPPPPPPDRGGLTSGEEPEEPSYSYRPVAEHQHTSGAIVVTEYEHRERGVQRTTLATLDTSATDISYPASTIGLTVEGYEAITGVTHHTTERDDQDRPVTIVGQASHEANRRTNTLDDPVSTIETRLSYNEAGLLETVIDTIDQPSGLIRFRHENVFNDQGQRTGYVRSRSVDINPATGEDTYDIEQVVVYQRGEQGAWREVIYRGFRDGLIPATVHEGNTTEPFSRSRITTYVTAEPSPEQLAYVIATSPETMELHEPAGPPGSRHEARTITLPSWIPKAAAYDIAHQTTTLEAAATEPHFPETAGVRILSQEEAVRTIGVINTSEESGEQAAVTDFINQLRARETVVLQRGRTAPEVLDAVAEFTGPEASRPFTPLQKLAVIAALHPVFSREDIYPVMYETVMEDYLICDRLLELLGTNKEAIIQAVEIIAPQLSDDAIHCIGLLLLR